MATLKVNDKRLGSNKEVTFESLEIGDVFENEHYVLCIKIDDTHCIYMNDMDIWEIADCEMNDMVFPLRATLIIEGRE